ncbi:uncharacterized protein LOC127748910 [Frankliniella occidentalis]|uniref:Uncharacterized protein LOC127748910 n=1 Tax=Frankliniella occidentalis TaxID=133901 RepID=A0A9C6U3M8_FRAOC|nr:uncharacterized protein LOC127748910 [Frankliniella occidentalis]
MKICEGSVLQTAKINPVSEIVSTSSDLAENSSHVSNIVENLSQTDSTDVSHSSVNVITEATNSVNCDSDKPAQDINNILRSEADKFVSKLYGKSKLPRQFVQDIIDDTSLFLQNGVLTFLKDNLTSLNLTNEQSSALTKAYDVVKNPFSHLRSEYFRFKYFTSTGEFIPPISYEIGEIDVAHGANLKKTKVYGQTVPIDLSLKQFLEIPNALNDILQYVESCKADSDIVQNFVQSELWKTKRSKFSDDDIVLPLHAYYDECQCNNPLGSHVSKLGCAYVQIACLPPECQSSINNIFVSLVFDSDYRCFSDAKAFAPLISKLKYLEEIGIVVNTSDGPKRVFFVCSLLLGDNLGLNSVGGFAEGFTANFFCRFCKTHREVTQTQIVEDVTTLRTKESYVADLAIDCMKLTGVKSDSVFNQLPTFHMTSNFCVDVFHDLCEGSCHYVMLHVLRHSITSKFFSLDLLNHRIEMFQYGPTDSNRIPLLCDEFAAKRKLKMSGSETLLFVKLFGIIIGDKVPYDDEHWKLYLKLCNLMDIVLCKSLSRRQGSALRVLVSEFNSMYVNVTGDTLKPKMHHLVHYSRIFENSGPMALTSTKTFERKHRSLLIPARATESRTNIAKTVTIQHQLNVSHHFKSLKSIIPSTEFGPSTEVLLSDFSNHSFVHNLPVSFHLSFSKGCLSANWVNFKGSTYKPGMILLLEVNESGGPVFGLLKSILLCENENFTFVFSYLMCSGFDDHLHAYEVEVSDEKWSTVLPSELYDPLPLSVHHSICSKKYVSLRHLL